MILDIISPYLSKIILVVIAFAVASVFVLFIRRYFSRLVKDHIVKDHAGKETAFRLIQRVIIIIIYLIVAFFAISMFFPGLSGWITSLLIGAGFLAIVIGMAAQRSLGNIFSGINIILTRPIRIGDAVVLRNEYGTVEDIALRHTVIKTWDNRRLMIPNSVLDDEIVINYSITDPKKLFPIVVSVPYDTDVEKAAKIMVEEAKKHQNVLKELEPIFQVLDFGEGAITLRLLFLAKDQPTAFGTGCDLRRAIKNRFDKEKIKISCPTRYTIIEEKGKK